MQIDFLTVLNCCCSAKKLLQFWGTDCYVRLYTLPFPDFIIHFLDIHALCGFYRGEC
jgi:hypothetical protein